MSVWTKTFLDELTAAVDGDRSRVQTAESSLTRYARSTLPQQMTPAGVVYPRTTEEVSNIVRFARTKKVPLYPISRGKNWGYGSAMAPAGGYLIVDLRRMNAIREINEELGYAVIEPGVSQGRLQAELDEHHPNLWMDANGAGPGASLIGNILERGFGHTPLGERAHHISGLEVVLGTGEVVRTGFRHYENAKTSFTYKYGIGPSLDGLFFQSSYGIVTSAGISLLPRPDRFLAFAVFAHEAQMPLLVERLGRLRRAGILQSTVHVANSLRVLTNKVQYPWSETRGRAPVREATIRRWQKEHRLSPWVATGGVYGAPAFVRGAVSAIRQELGAFKVRVIDERVLNTIRRISEIVPAHLEVGFARSVRNLVSNLEPAIGLLMGRQTDAYLRSAAWRSPSIGPRMDPIANGAGLIWVAPTLPSTGEHAREVERLVRKVYHEYGFDAPVTFTFVNERTLIATTNINFNREDPVDVAAASQCYETVTQRLLAAGYPPYRCGIGGYSLLQCDDDTFWHCCHELKTALDPDGIISPGHYVGAPRQAQPAAGAVGTEEDAIAAGA